MKKLLKIRGLRKLTPSIQFRVTLFSTFLFIALLFAGVYHQFQTILLDALNDQNTNFVARVSETASFAEEFMQNIANQVFYSQSINKLRSYETLTNSQVISGIRELNSFCATSTIIDSIYIYNGKQNYIYSTSTFGAVSDTVDTFADSVASSLFLNRSPEQRLELIPRYSYAADSYSDRLVYSFMFYELNMDGLPEDNAIMLNINASWFTKLYFGNDEEHSFIIDGSGHYIAAQESTENLDGLTAQVLSWIQNGTSSGYFPYTTAQSEMRLCFFSSMEKHDWYYIMSLNYNDCLNGLKGIEEKTFLFLLLGFAILCIAGTSISLNIYLPYRKDANRQAAFEPNAPNDTEKLLESLNLLIEKNSNSESIRQSVQEIIRGEVLKNLLQGDFQEEEWSRLRSEYHFSIEPNAATVLCLISGLRLSQYLEYFRQNIPCCEGVEIQNEYTVIFMQQLSENALQAALEQLHALHPSTYFITSPEVPHWEALPQAYERLLECRHLLFLHPEQRLVSSKEYEALDDSTVLLNEKAERIIFYLKKGTYLKAFDSWKDFTGELSGKSYSAVRYALTSLGKSVLKLNYSSAAEREDYEAACRAYQRELETLKDIHTLDAYFEPLFQKITAAVRQEQTSRRGSVIADVMLAIQASYSDPQLSSQALANQFGLSSTYLCRIFRKATGYSLMDYVNQLRISHAQELLLDPSVKVKDIPQQVGIDNKQYFFKLFKDITGKTPKQFQSERNKS